MLKVLPQISTSTLNIYYIIIDIRDDLPRLKNLIHQCLMGIIIEIAVFTSDWGVKVPIS
jgi:hypothetical protein